MTKDLAKSSWEENYQNKSLSGIEVRDKNGKLVSFITIKHDEVLEKNTPHRITMKVDENAEPILPPPQTFEEIIQAKRRYQMLLYGSGSSASASLSDRTARRVSAAARQAASASNLQQNRRKTACLTSRLASSSRTKNKKEKASRKIAAVWPKPAPFAQPAAPVKVESTARVSETPSTSKPSSSKTKSSNSSPSSPPVTSTPCAPVASSSSSCALVTSMRDFKKHMPNLPIDPKEVKLLLKSAPPGACVVLADGTVVKKSRRGGARAGAGRKRSRPLPTNQQPRASGSSSRDEIGAQRASKLRASETSNDLSYSDLSLEGEHQDASNDLTASKVTIKKEPHGSHVNSK